METKYFKLNFCSFALSLFLMWILNISWHILLVYYPESNVSRFIVIYFFEKGLPKPRSPVIEFIIPGILWSFIIIKNNKVIIPFPRPSIIVVYPALILLIEIINSIYLPHTSCVISDHKIHGFFQILFNFIKCYLLAFC